MIKRKLSKQNPNPVYLYKDGDWLKNKENVIGAIGTGLDLLGEAAELGKGIDTTKYIDRTNAFGNQQIAATSSDDLLNQWADAKLQHVDKYDITGRSSSEETLGGAGSFLGAVGKGALAGAAFSPIGAVVGGAIGGITNGIGQIFGAAKTQRKINELNEQIDAANRRRQDALMLAAENLGNAQAFNLESNYAAYGGSINIKPENKGKFTKAAKSRNMGVQEFAAKVLANKEDYSPLMVKRANFARNAAHWNADGGPIGHKSQKRNKYQDAVYSLFGDGRVANTLNHFYDNFVDDRGPLDYIYDSIMNEVGPKNAVERANQKLYKKQLKKHDKVIEYLDKHPKLEELNKTFRVINRNPYGIPQYANGGALFSDFTNGVTIVGNGGTHEQNPNNGVQMGIAPDGKPNLVEEGEIIYNDYVFSNRLKVPNDIKQKYKLKGETFADAFKNAQKESKERPNDSISKNSLDNIAMILTESQEAIRENKEANKFACGGRKYENGSELEFIKDSAAEDAELAYLQQQDPQLMKELAAIRNKNNTGDLSNLSWLRYAEPAANLAAVSSDLMGLTNTPARYNQISNLPQIGVTTLGDYLTYTPFDTRYALNKQQAQAAAQRRALMQSSSPSRNAAILASDYNTIGAIGDLYRQAQEYNVAQRQRVGEFNRGTNQINAQMAMQAASENARNNMNYQMALLRQAQMNEDSSNTMMGARAANVGALASSIANIGREQDAKNRRDMLIRSRVYGTLSEKPSDWSDARWEAYQNAITGKGFRCGGKMKTKKKGLTY